MEVLRRVRHTCYASNVTTRRKEHIHNTQTSCNSALLDKSSGIFAFQLSACLGRRPARELFRMNKLLSWVGGGGGCGCGMGVPFFWVDDFKDDSFSGFFPSFRFWTLLTHGPPCPTKFTVTGENDHDAVRRVGKLVTSKVTTIPCMVDRICTGRQIGELTAVSRC